MTSKCTLIVLSLDRRRVVHLLAEMARDRQKELRHPVFEQIAVGQPLEQRIPVMLVHVDEPGQHEAAVGVDHLIETRGRRHCRGSSHRRVFAPSTITKPPGWTLRLESTVTT